MASLSLRSWSRQLLRSHARGTTGGLGGGGLAPHFSLGLSPDDDRERRRPPQQTRAYHTTERREILPLIGVAGILLIARYSYRAVHRMEEEWEEYEWKLQQYERRHGSSVTSEESVSVRTLAIDLGTVYTKMASSTLETKGKAEVVVSREGDRYFFNGLIVEDDEGSAVGGRKALERFFFPRSDEGGNVTTVQLPWASLLTSNPNTHKLVSQVIAPVLQETLERLESTDVKMRYVITVPSLLANSEDFRKVFTSLSSESEPTIVPDPVAAVWGAQSQGLIPMDDGDKPNKILVVDLGGYLTQLAIVEKDRLQSSLVFPWGGETLVERAVDVLSAQSPHAVEDDRALSALQVQARAAVAELQTSLQVPVHVPYIFATPGDHHLDTTLSRSVLEQAVQSEISELATTDDMGSLSPHLPTPTNLESLFLSMITELLERNNEIPQNIDHIMLVGGASRFPLVRQSLIQAVSLLMPAEEASAKLVHDAPASPELTVLGGANMLPTYNYDMDRGLVRIEQP
jgi:molecular chaperone DnaK (HSP70)